jgi:hypothetical protein
MEKHIALTLKDIFGGDGIVRYIEAKEEKLSRTKSNSKTRADIGVKIETSINEITTELVKREINTFRIENGKPVLRLGGAHGKLWGTLKAIRTSLYTLGNPSFRSARMMDMIQVTPIWVALELLAEIQVQQLPQILNSPGHPMVITYYDVIPLAKCVATLTYPDAIDNQVAQLLEQLKFTSFLNKRRASVESMDIIGD